MSVDVQATWRVPQQRRRLISQYVAMRGWVTVGELADRFAVSVTTARRDLNALARERLILRVHGGAGWRDTAGR